MIRDVFPAELDAIRDLLSRANDTQYDLARVAEEKCFGRGVSGEPRVRMYGDDGIAVTCGRYLRLLAVDRERRGRGIGTALLRDAEAIGARVIGAEAGNYFVPGVPEELVGFFRGYRETARTANLIAETPSPSPGLRPPSPGGRGIERERILEFVGRHFGPIWRFEASRAAELIAAEEGGDITGFAAIEANNRGLGTFGPTGVAEAFRGRGIGRALLLDALAELRSRGYEQAIIPWTDAVEFYRRACGATVAATFVTLASTR